MTTLAAEFEAIDRRIADAQTRVDTCRQAMALSRAAMVAAGVTLALVLTVAGTFRTPTVVFSAVAALIGGTVWLGASRTSLREAADELEGLDAAREAMIDRVAVANGWRDRAPTVH